MEFSDSFLVNASIKQVYSTILDPHAISSCLPDLESMEVIDENKFKAKFKVGLSYIRGSVNFEFTLTDKIENKHAKLIGVGTGLSSLSFIDSYLEKNNKINVISPNFNNNFFENKYLNPHIDKYLPPQMIKKLKEVKNYFFYNKIRIDKNCKVFGSLEFGGLSNYWGLQVDQNISDDIEYLNYNIRKKIKESFIKIFQIENF